MSEINKDKISISQFLDIFRVNKKPILFWDTCSLLEIIRFLYRKGNINSYEILDKINGLIQDDKIYSVASFLTIKEWNDNVEKIITETKLSLKKTSDYHKNSIDVINRINGTEFSSENLGNKNLVDNLIRLADDIISKTYFIETDEIANKALERVVDKKPPARKKNEFKDSAIWETIILISKRIEEEKEDSESIKKIFYTVNTSDFIDKSRTPHTFYGSLLSEASLVDLICCYNLEQISEQIKEYT